MDKRKRKGKVGAVLMLLFIFGVVIGTWMVMDGVSFSLPRPMPDWPGGIDEYAWAQWGSEEPVMIGIYRDEGLIYFPGQKRAYGIETLNFDGWWIRRIPQPEAYEPNYGGQIS